MLSPSVPPSPRPDRTQPAWTRTQVRFLILLAVLFVVQVTASALYVLGG